MDESDNGMVWMTPRFSAKQPGQRGRNFERFDIDCNGRYMKIIRVWIKRKKNHSYRS